MVTCEIEKIWILNSLQTDGFLKMSQMHTYFKCYEKQPTENTERIFKMFDENNDGKFQKDEMAHFLSKVLECQDYKLKYTPPVYKQEGENSKEGEIE